MRATGVWWVRVRLFYDCGLGMGIEPSCTKWLFPYRSVQWEMGYGERDNRERGFGGSRWLWVFGQIIVMGNGDMIGNVGYSTYYVARLLFTNCE